MNRAKSRVTVLALAGGLAAAPLAAHAQAFTAPSQLGPAFAPPALPGASTAVGVGPGGTALAVWKSREFGASWSMHKPGGAWTTEIGDISIARGADLQLHMNKDGTGTLASVDHAGNVQATRWNPTDYWGKAEILGRGTIGTPIALAGNANGPNEIFFDAGGGPGGYVMVVSTERGATPQLATNVDGKATVVAAAMDDAGDMVVAFEQSREDCSTTPCNWNNYSVYAARRLVNSPAWERSPRLTPVIRPDPWVVSAVIDPLGRAGLLLQAGPAATVIQATRQQASGTWGALVPAFTDTTGGTLALWGASIGPHDQATYGAVDVNTTNSVLAGDGNLVTQSWSAPANLSITDASPPTAGLAYGGNAKGAAALLWVDLDDTVRATLRTSATSGFPPAETVIAGDGCTTGTGAACRSARRSAINTAGDAVVVYRQTDASTGNVAVFAATTN